MSKDDAGHATAALEHLAVLRGHAAATDVTVERDLDAFEEALQKIANAA